MEAHCYGDWQQVGCAWALGGREEADLGMGQLWVARRGGWLTPANISSSKLLRAWLNGEGGAGGGEETLVGR